MGKMIKRKSNALAAALLAFVFVFSLLGIPNTAHAQSENESASKRTIKVSGTDFMQPNAQGWEVLKVDDLEDRALYITVEKDGAPLSNPIKFTAADNNADAGHSGTGSRIAQIVAVQILADKNAGQAQTATELFADPYNHATYTIEVSTALMQGDKLYQGAIYPVYAKIIDTDGSTTLSLLGIRTANADERKSAKNIGVGQTYYKQNTTEEAYPISYSLKMQGDIDNVFDDNLNAYVVTYEQNDKNSVEGMINYVDATSGKIVKQEAFSGVDENGKRATIKKSFTATDPDDDAKTNYYRVVSGLAGSQVELSFSQASYTVRVVAVPNMDESSYGVTINYVDENDELLWSDSVDVKGYGYRYTLPNTFSMNKGSQVESADGVNFYRLNKVIGAQVATDGSSDEGDLEEQSGSGSSQDENNPSDGSDQNVSIGQATDAHGTAIVLTKDMADADFIMNDGKRTIKAVYDSQEATKAVDFTLVEMDGETGKEIGRITKTLTPEASTDFHYQPTNKKIDGKTYVPWSGNANEVTYSWESLGQGEDLLQYVYYVPEDYVAGNAYDITIQYMNIANGQVLRQETLAVDSEITNYVEFTGESRFTQDGNEYVRLAGQDAGIRHAFFSPDRTYTIYYRNVNDTINANTTIVRTQIIETNRTVVTPGGGLTAVAAPIEDAGAGEPALDAGIGAGDGAVVINDDDNPLAGPGGLDTASERTIEDSENPLASGALSKIDPVVLGAVIALLALGVIGGLLARRRKHARTAEGMSDSYNAQESRKMNNLNDPRDV